MATRGRCATCGKLICVCEKTTARRAPRDPNNEALDKAFKGAVRARVVKDHPGQLPDDLAPEVLDAILAGKSPKLSPEAMERIKGTTETLLTVTAPADLAELRACLAIGSSGFHCMCAGGPTLEIDGPEGGRARITLHHGQSIRWDDAWSSDAALVDGGRLVKWLAAKGVRGPLEEVEEAARRKRESGLASERWQRAMPRCLAPLWEELSGGNAPFGWVLFVGGGAAPPPPGLERARSALQAAYRNEGEAIRALLGWLGEGAGPWSGFPIYESVAEGLLTLSSTNAIVAAVEPAAATRAQLTGAARMLARRGGAGATLSLDLRERLRSAVESAPANLARFDAVF